MPSEKALLCNGLSGVACRQKTNHSSHPGIHLQCQFSDGVRYTRKTKESEEFTMMNAGMLKQTVISLEETMKKIGKEVNAEQVAVIVENHAATSALSAAAAGIFPGAGGTVALGIAAHLRSRCTDVWRRPWESG